VIQPGHACFTATSKRGGLMSVLAGLPTADGTLSQVSIYECSSVSITVDHTQHSCCAFTADCQQQQCTV
jgi:hypothetical protein